MWTEIAVGFVILLGVLNVANTRTSMALMRAATAMLTTAQERMVSRFDAFEAESRADRERLHQQLEEQITEAMRYMERTSEHNKETMKLLERIESHLEAMERMRQAERA